MGRCLCAKYFLCDLGGLLGIGKSILMGAYDIRYYIGYVATHRNILPDPDLDPDFPLPSDPTNVPWEFVKRKEQRQAT
jgi:hypothetical protein